MALPKQNVDGYLGNGWYDEWQEMDRKVETEKKRLVNAKTRLNLSIISDLYDRIRNDVDIADAVKQDYDAGLNLIALGKRVNKQTVATIHDLYTISIVVAETENDMLEALWTVGLVAAFIAFPMAALELRANELAKLIPELEKELKEADKEARNAKVKTGIHAAITVFEFIFPEISLLGRAGIYLGEVVVNKALGPSDPTKFQRYEGDTTPGVKQFSEAVHHAEEYGHTAHNVAQKVGTAATAATFYFDAKEISETSERAEKLKEIFEKVKESYDKLQKLLDDNKPRIKDFLLALERWLQAVDDVRMTAANARSARTSDMTAAKYDPHKTLTWPIVP
ncbi:MAG: hypothetical protein ABI878_09460 [Acidobacteriota bacterium]